MHEVIYGLSGMTAFLCAYLLLRGYRKRRNALLLWSGVFFAIQTFNNVLLVVDKTIFPRNDLAVVRHAVALVAVIVLLYGLIMQNETGE
ncbi:conserved membrane protein of unknown function [Nitrospira sp. KM1]|uniref:DUF5985 family protein n=1 Tax=Nitrospira sp. KM1 TaxID=1936990 RepID=UPI0013A7B3C2|nr:DUF5985 family protein [Nitrospira sp. KM1]BCA56095.1 conserved membrane protein of unknown function [Nitrospira sp. KM1]